MKIVVVIPARMASSRFPGKILFPIYGLPMIEHVRRRALIPKSIAEVVVATCDNEIASVVRSFGGNVKMTSKEHENGTTRAAEAIKNINCTHVMLIQGDEPLLLPRHIDAFAKAIELDPTAEAWNATCPIEHPDELDRHSFVKCAIGSLDRILYCFRRSPCFSDFNKQQAFVRKLLGIISFRKDFLITLAGISPSPNELSEAIEQMRILENNYSLKSVPVQPGLASVNEPEDVDIVLDYMQSNAEQLNLLKLILKAT